MCYSTKEEFQPSNGVTIIQMRPDNLHGFTHWTTGQVFNIQLFTQTMLRISLSWKISGVHRFLIASTINASSLSSSMARQFKPNFETEYTTLTV